MKTTTNYHCPTCDARHGEEVQATECCSEVGILRKRVAKLEAENATLQTLLDMHRSITKKQHGQHERWTLRSSSLEARAS